MEKFLLIAFILYTSTARAQLSKAVFVRYLTNGSSRTWILTEDHKVTSGDSCMGDVQTFKFYINGSLSWSKCNKATPIVKKLKWTVSELPDAPGEFKLNFSEPIIIADGKSVQNKMINLPVPQLNVRGKKMIWNDPPTMQWLSDVVFTFTSKN